MKNDIHKLEEKYINSFKTQTKYFKGIYEAYLDETDLEWWKFNKDSKEITISIINRLKAYYNHGDGIKNLLDKNKLTPASDFFVEQIAFFVKLYLSKVNPGLVVCSERRYKINNGTKNITLFPDISILNDKDELVAIIECKTQLGRNRKDWADEFKKRRDVFAKKNQNIKWFYCVMTGDNWKGFGFEETFKTKDYNKIDKNVSYYCLLDEETHPRKYESNVQIDNRIEDLLLELKELKTVKRDVRLFEFYKEFASDDENLGRKNLVLTTKYLNKEYKIKLDRWGRLGFEDRWYATPNLLYNKGIKLFANPDFKGSSGKNSLSQFYYKEVKLNDDIPKWKDLKSKMEDKKK